MTEITVVKASHVIPFIDYIKELGLPVDDLLKDVGLEREQFNSADNLIPETPIWTLLELVARDYDLIDIGFRVTDRLSLDSFGVFGEQIMHAQSLKLALNDFIEQMAQQSNCPPFWLNYEEGGVWFCRLGTQGIKVGHWQVEQHVVSMMTLLVRSYSGQYWRPQKVYLQTDDLAGLCGSHYILNSDISLKQKVTAIWIPDDILSNKPQLEVQKNTALYDKTPIPNQNVPLTKVVMLQDKEVACTNAEKTAQKLGVNVRTLQRLLKQDGTTFRQLSDEILFEQAQQLLLKSKLSILEVGLELGYSEAANFTRAFRRWSGMAPSEFVRTAQL